MYRFLSIIAVVVIVLVGGFYLFKQSGTVLPWIEVLAAPVIEVSDSGEIVEEFSTGDKLNSGTTVESGDNGLAIIHFPDGSEARLDSNTKVVLDEAFFSEPTGELQAHFTLIVGRLWSKITALATPESSWEVQTSNAVAVVRGTAFGVEYVGGKSSIVGSENSVEVAVVDPETQRVVKGAVVVIEPDTFVEIVDEVVKEIVESAARGDISSDESALSVAGRSPVITVRKVSADILNQEWVGRNKKLDSEANQRRKQEKSEARQELSKENDRNTVIEQINSSQSSLEKSADVEIREELGARKIIETANEGATSVKIAPEPASAVIQPVESEPAKAVIQNSLKPVELRIQGDLTSGDFLENRQVSFKAELIMSDGSSRDVTKEAKWQVLGLIGEIESGIFFSRLDSSVAEFGEGSGSIIVTWVDQQTGEAFLAKTEIIRIIPNIEVILDSTRG